jgi:elongator complex protein 6
MEDFLEREFKLRSIQALDMQALISAKRLLYINGIGGHAANGDITAAGFMIDLVSTKVEDIESTIRSALVHEPGTKTTLIIDGIDFLLASQQSITALILSQLLTNLRKYADQMILRCSADAPLLHNAIASATPLEMEHLAFVTIMAHQSHTTMQLRSLDTGAAKDVSGVLRISRGGLYESTEDIDSGSEYEWLYQVKGDGGVRVWSRGE